MAGFRTLLMALVLGAALLAGCSENEGDDPDEDGLYTWEEESGWVVTVDLLERRIQRHVTSDPQVRDTDGDGLEDVFEAALGLDPRSPDTDEDGLTDCQEARHTVRAECEDPEFEGTYDGGYRTEASRADSDPGYSRYVEVRGFADETGTLSGSIPPYGDGIPDLMELEGFQVTMYDGTTRRVVTDPMSKDTDGDGLEDGEEAYVHGTDPTMPDTDGDGCQDGFDIVPGGEERLHPGLVSFTPKKDTSSVRFRVHLADARVELGTDAVAVDGETDLSTLDPEGVRPAQCSFPAHAPWVPVEILVEQVEPEPRILDITSISNPDSQFRVWWNVRDGTFAWRPPASPDGAEGPAAEDGTLVWEGVDGRLVLAPSVTVP